MKFTLNRDKTIASVYGHAIEFKKGVPTHVPPIMHKEVLAAGGEPDEEIPEEDEMSLEDRDAAILAAMKKVIERDERNEFTGAGVPRPQVLSRDCGFYVSGKERDKAWAKLHEEGDV